MGLEKLEIFASTLASTKLRNTLSIIRVDSKFPLEKAQEIFNRHRFNLEVVSDAGISFLGQD
jgi:hypothetical protein